ncbi:stage III sporulation protein AG [Alkalicoccobacillus porphyridii]|uniref:Stage III sporulation protein AG n=1 Tax=Alkalicoccobacillus porphyridii TaxID=2597270 RepID=A0A553ZVE4_9BACI|nr:stage III sporulation protein AG [Alkalicoccobacillus porphyridii]TSB45393.1 stage III sporulation protein AG [Alkalicoccobacillus porphyridii]
MKKEDPKGFYSWFKKLTDKNEPDKRKSYRYILILGCAGLLLMVLNQFFTEQQVPQAGQPDLPAFQADETKEEEDTEVFKRSEEDGNTMKDYEDSYENQLRENLEQIVGLNDVSVMINLAETEKQIYEKNASSKNQQTSETDREGGTREVTDQTIDEQTVIVRNGDTEGPLLIQTEKPSIRGVLVVAEGVENAQVKAWVIEAVSRVLDVPAHRISVMPKKSEEE